MAAILNHFSEAFAKTAADTVHGWRESGASAFDAARNLEILCSKSNEEFAVDGVALVERIYNGKFRGGQTTDFQANE